MQLDALITGRIATLAGEAGFGWVEALGIRDGRVAFAGTEVDWRRAPTRIPSGSLSDPTRWRSPA